MESLALHDLPEARLARIGEARRLATLRVFVPALKRTATHDILVFFDGLLAALALRGDKLTIIKVGNFVHKAAINK
jgi:hypothetical protein